MSRLAADVLAASEAKISHPPAEFLWPVSDAEFGSLVDDALAAYAEALAELGDTPERDALQTDFNFLFLVVQHIHALWVAQRCSQAGVELVVGDGSRHFHLPQWSALGRTFDVQANLGERFRIRLRDFARDALLNDRVTQRVGSLLGLSSTWCLGSRSYLRAEYIKSHNLACRHVNVARLLNRDPARMPAELAPTLSRVLSGLMRRLEALSSRFAEAAFDCAAISESWTRRLRAIAGHQAALAAVSPPRTLLLNEVARPMHRLIALSFGRRGTKVVGFHHGNDVVNAWEPTSGFTEYGHCQEFVCPTWAMAEFHHQEFERSPARFLRAVAFTGLESDHYRALYDGMAADRPSQHIRRVMVMGYPLNAARYFHSSADFHAFQSDVENRVGEVITASGLTAVYKAHPDRLTEARAAKAGMFAEFRAEPFEQIWREADAFVFACTTSTTFGFALLTPRPVIVLDIEGRAWNPDVYPAMSRRCRMVRAWFDGRNRLCFDEEQFRQALLEPVTAIDHSYAEQFMFPPSCDGSKP